MMKIECSNNTKMWFSNEFYEKFKSRTIRDLIVSLSEDRHLTSPLELYLKKEMENFINNYAIEARLTEQEKARLFNCNCIDFLHGTLDYHADYFVMKRDFKLNGTRYFDLKFSTKKTLKSAMFFPDPVYCEHNTIVHTEILKLQKTYDFADIDGALLITKSWGNTPLVLSSKMGNQQAALALIAQHRQQGVGIDDVDDQGMTALHWACFFRDNELIEALLGAGADPDIKNKNEQTARDLYEGTIPSDLIAASSGSTDARCHLPNVPLIAENKVRLLSINDTLINRALGKKHMAMSCMVDILFHMDKIAFHQLGVAKTQLEANLQADEYRSNDPNAAFELFVFHYFYDFIQKRNQIEPLLSIKKLLSRSQCLSQENLVASKHELPPSIPTDVSNASTIDPIFSFNDAVHCMEKHGPLGKKVVIAMLRLQEGQKNHWNPYWMGSSKKLEKIISVISNISETDKLDLLLDDKNSNLYQALNMQRLNVFTFFGGTEKQTITLSSILNNPPKNS